MPALRNLPATLLRIPASGLSLCIKVYRLTLSPDHGLMRHFFPHGVCRHEPTCSGYALKVLEERNLFVAVWLIAKRIVSCNPWTKVTDEKLIRTIHKEH